MGKFVIVAILAMTTALAGCTGQAEPQNSERADRQKATTVVVNEGMSKEEEKRLNERIADLEDKVEEQPAEQPAPEEPESSASAEDAARSAAQDYYEAAAAGHYLETYSELDSEAQSQFTEDEWVTANTVLESDAASYSINSVEMVDDSTAEVNLTVNLPDGSSSERVTRFVLENGAWKHELTQDEYDLFASATAAPASATATASASASATADASADTKHVKVVISSNKPADVSISNDSMSWFVTEEIVGTKTYERDISRNSGLSVSAITDAYNAQTTIQVYEDGVLVTQDSDPHGNAMVNY